MTIRLPCSERSEIFSTPKLCEPWMMVDESSELVGHLYPSYATYREGGGIKAVSRDCTADLTFKGRLDRT